jgi:hypothetical protein
MTETPDSLIPYDEIVQEALRTVVGRVLGQVEASGGMLPGQHHFYITFRTGAPGVSIPTRLKERFPEEMTIVLQNKFWDLKVEEDGFSVGLSFNQIPSTLVIPFRAITAFVDPAVDFGSSSRPSRHSTTKTTIGGKRPVAHFRGNFRQACR